MNSQRLGGIAMVAAGVILFIIGMNASKSVSDRLSNFFTGHFTDETVWFIVGGVALVIIGAMLAGITGSKTAG